MFRVFGAAWRFLTIFPFPIEPGDDEGELLTRTPEAFPWVGAVLGLASWVVATLLGAVVPGPVVAVMGVAMLLAYSAGLHMDGLADSADGLLSPGRSRDKALEVMRDSRIGAHGAMALAVVLLFKTACLAVLPVDEMALALFLMPLAGRAAMAFPIVLLPYARENGLGKAFITAHPRRALVSCCVWVGVAMAMCLGLAGGLVGFGMWVGLGLGWVWFLRRRLGGGTGDTYGTACELAEAAAAFAMVVAGQHFG